MKILTILITLLWTITTALAAEDLVSPSQSDERDKALIQSAFDKDSGVVTGSIGPDANILKLRPPMVFSKDNADYMLKILGETLSKPL